MLQSDQIRHIQIEADRLRLAGEHALALDRARHHAEANPNEEVVVYAYVQHVIERRAKDHYAPALAAIERLNQPWTIADYYEAELLAATGQTHHAIARLAEQPHPGKGVGPMAFAVWLCCEYGDIQGAPAIEPTDLMSALALLRHAGMTDDLDAGRRAMSAVLDHLPDENLSAWRRLGGVWACPAADVLALDWLLDAAEAWGGRLTWLARHRRDEYAVLARRADLPVDAGPCPTERVLIDQIERGALAEATATYLDMALQCRADDIPLPEQWRHTQVGECTDTDAALEACESMLLHPDIDAAVILPWYQAVWADLIDTQSPGYRSGMHHAIICRTHSSRARLAAACADADACNYTRAQSVAWPLTQRATWRDRAHALIEQCERAKMRYHVRSAMA